VQKSIISWHYKSEQNPGTHPRFYAGFRDPDPLKWGFGVKVEFRRLLPELHRNKAKGCLSIILALVINPGPCPHLSRGDALSFPSFSRFYNRSFSPMAGKEADPLVDDFTLAKLLCPIDICVDILVRPVLPSPSAQVILFLKST